MDLQKYSPCLRANKQVSLLQSNLTYNTVTKHADIAAVHAWSHYSHACTWKQRGYSIWTLS